MRAAHSTNQLQEVLTDFWFNHFNVFIGDELVRFGIVRYETEAIGPMSWGASATCWGAVAKSWALMTLDTTT